MKKPLTRMDRVSKQIHTTKPLELINFMRHSDYKSFMALVKGDRSLDAVKALMGDHRVGVGGGMANQIQYSNMAHTYRYFETFNQWQWFDLYSMGSHELWLFWMDVYQALYVKDRRHKKDGYSHLTGNERAAIYLFTRYINYTQEDDYFYWLLPELLQLPSDLLNIIHVSGTKELTFNLDYFGVEQVGDQLAKELLQQVKYKLKDRTLSVEWIDFLHYIKDSLEWVILNIQDDPRYKSKFKRFLNQVKLMVTTSKNELQSIRRVKQTKSEQNK